ncbi:MAG: cytochrome C oxidase subunit IV family protein [Lentimonas sp.]
MSEADYNPLPVSPVDHSTETERYHVFVNLALVLAAITGIELVLVYLPFKTAFIFTVLVSLSLFKFVAVIAWFMHLIYDKLLLTLAFGTGLVIAAGTYTALLFLLSTDFVAPQEIPGSIPGL